MRLTLRAILCAFDIHPAASLSYGQPWYSRFYNMRVCNVTCTDCWRASIRPYAARDDDDDWSHMASDEEISAALLNDPSMTYAERMAFYDEVPW